MITAELMEKTEQMWEIFWSWSQLDLQVGQFKERVKGYSGIPVLSPQLLENNDGVKRNKEGKGDRGWF